MLRASVGSDARSRFRIINQLGSGGYGAVFEAVDLRSGQRVALKELQEVNAASIGRFKQEFRVLADRHHPNLVRLNELIEDDGHWLLVMELIPGHELLAYVRGGADNDNAGAAWDETRLRTALGGMAEGLVALHGFGVLHRDLKPSNVRVTPSGRAVLLDFGLVTNIDGIEQSTDKLVGTVAYMAPEQATSHNIGPPADWYALGVCLFEALTGRRPFEAEATFQLLTDKQNSVAPRASSLVEGVPPDLDELCAGLLERDPDKRPPAAHVLAVLGGMSQATRALLPILSTGPVPTPFAGRDAELRLLERALMRTHVGELKIVLIEGESGVGKSELVAEFLRRTHIDKPALIALHGRCYENEQVSYKAFDGCIDDLSRCLRAMRESECAALLPPRAAALGQLFPVLRTIAAITKAPRANISADLTARRIEAFGALAALLSKLAEERPLVLLVDDLQWADSESFRLMQALVEHPEPPPILILATLRPRDELEPDVRTQVESIRSWRQTDIVQLLGLPPGQTEQLAAKLLSPGVPSEWLRTLADESEGHPLFLGELVQFARSHDFSNRGAVTLEAALRARIERLDRPARELLELVCLAGRPYGAHIFARALGSLSVEEPARALLAAKLLRLRRGHELSAYHDRIRHAAVSLIASTRLGGLHRQLAEALADDLHADVSEQALHWDLAGEPERAIDAYASAARNAFEALAFSRAVQLSARALELLQADADPRFTPLTTQRADALACAGQSAEAAVHYQRAADRAEGDVRLRLRSRVAQQLMLSADMRGGFEAARSLLAELGARIPVGTLATVLRLVYDYLFITVRVPLLQVPTSGPYDARRKLVYEVVDELLLAVSVLHPLAFVMLLAHQIRLGRRSFIPEGNAQVHSIVGWFRAASGNLRDALPLFAEGRRLCAELGDPVISARQAYIEGTSRLSGGDWTNGIACLEHAHTLAQAHARDNPALITDIRFTLASGLYMVGEYARLVQGMEVWLADARERNDRRSFAMLTGSGRGFLRHLMQDAPEKARQELETAVLAVPTEPFSFVHFGYTTGMLITLISQGGSGALQWLDERKKLHARRFIMRLHIGRRALHSYRALAALAACVTAPPSERPALLREVRRMARKLARDQAPFLRAYVHILLAQVEAIEGSREHALELARAGRARAEAAGIALARSASYLVALLEDGHDRGEVAQRALAFFRDQGFRTPMRALSITLPALPLIAPRERARRPSTSLILERYDVLSSRSSAGFGAVIEARDLLTDRRVALKELVSASGRSLERFKQEFRALQDILHENLVALDALFAHRGRWYIAMELLEGDALLAFVRPEGVLQPERVREAFAGIAQGLAALHAAGFVHRDVVPDNVIVAAGARAVLRDFGAIARTGDARDATPLGDPAYTAPEQRSGAVPHASADVFSLGACLFHALTGRPPFASDSAFGAASETRSEPPELPHESGLEDLTAMCLRMLASEPEARPSLADVHEVLRGEVPLRSVIPLSLVAAEQAARFVGRARELEQLADASEQTPDGLVLALVEGESGVGKSTLVSQFCARLEASSPGLLVLRGRCYENEQVSHKAFDGAVDQLAHALRALSSPDCEALLPKRAALLAQLFPVLGTVPAIAQAPQKGLPVEPLARQHAAIQTFVELLTQLTHRFELVFVVDDLHWADRESFRLLRLLMERAEDLPMLFVCTVCSACEVSPDAAASLSSLRAQATVHELRLEGLSEAAVTALAGTLSGEDLTFAERVHLARESKGHPLFLRELIAQHGSGTSERGATTLDQALLARLESFDEHARTLLSLVALSGKPHSMRVYARAMDRHELPREALRTLLGRGFLRRGPNDELSCYHDRLRGVTLDQLTPEARRELSRRLASALDPERPSEAAERARLWDAAGDVDRAVGAYEQAGAHAAEVLAFAQSEQHYAHALALLGEQRDVRWQRVIVAHAHALVRVGRSADAARGFQAAATIAEGEQRVSLRILAAQQLIQSAQVEPGMEAAHALLAELGIAPPRTTLGTLSRLGWERSLLALRGLDLRASAEAPGPLMRMRLEAAWSLALPLSWLDPLASTELSVRHLRMALAAGDPTHVARSLGEEAFGRAVQNADDPRVDPLIERARALCARGSDPSLEAVLTFREGAIANYRWQLPRAAELLERSLQIVTERCPEEAFLRTNIRTALGVVWTSTGQHPRFATASGEWLAEARERSDQFALTMLTGLGLGMLPLLMADLPERALAEIARHHAHWPRTPCSYAHFGEIVSTSYANCYRGGDAARKWLEPALPQLSKAFLFKTPAGKSSLSFFHAVALVHAYPTASRTEAAALRARGHAIAQSLERMGSAFARHVSPLLRLALAVLDGHLEQAHRLAVEVRRGGEETGNFVSTYALLYVEGLLEGGETGREKQSAALSAYESRGWKNPRRAIAMFTPAIDLLESRPP